MNRRLQSIFVTIAAVILLPTPVPASAEVPVNCTADKQPISAKNLAPAKRPIVLVHGWTGAPLEETGRLLDARLPGKLSIFAYDYSHWSSYWAANDHIAPCLAKYINDVSQAHIAAGGDGRVILVAHSMGGLATRYATSASHVHDPVSADTLPYVITIATPHLGSPWGNTPLAWLKEIWQVVLGHAFPAPWAEDGQKCLAPHQDDSPLPSGCDGLPPWLPSATHLAQVAGDITVDRTVFGFTLYGIHLGSDGVVPVESALGYPRSGPGGQPKTTGNDPKDLTDSCRVDYALLSFSARDVYKDISFGPSVALDLITSRDLQAGRFTLPVAVYLGLATKAAACSHIHLPTDQSALDQVTEALKLALADLNRMNLHKFDFSRMSVPAGLCNTATPVRLSGGKGSAPPRDTSIGKLNIERTEAPIVYGDLDGDGFDEAAVDAFCYPEGGNAILGEGFTIYRSTEGGVQPIGIITAKYQPPQTYLSTVQKIELSNNRIVAHEEWHKDGDAHCCPSGRARTEWTYSSGQLKAGRPVVTP